MNFEELHSSGCLKGRPIRAVLKETGQSAPSFACPAWQLEYNWVSAQKRVLLFNMGLRVVNFGGNDCCVVVAEAIAPGEGTPCDEDYRAMAFLLNPSDKCVWEAIDSWVTVGSIAAHELLRGTRVTSVTPQDFGVLELRVLEGAELDSDTLASAIEKLLSQGQLEAELARQLGIKVPLYCAIVETPMMLKSLLPPSEETMTEWRLHKERELVRGLNEGIWS